MSMIIFSQIEAYFPKLPMLEDVRSEWETNAKKSGDEILEAFTAFSAYKWWEAPASILFADFAGLTFLPDEVFSYYLPGCILRSFSANIGMESFDHVLFRVARSTYCFQNLDVRQIITFGWYLVELSNHPNIADTGSLNISLQKINDYLQLLESNDEISAVINAINKIE